MPSRVRHVSPNPATPGSQRLTSCSGRKPSPAWKLKEASLQRPTRWQGPSKPHPHSGILQAWPGNRGTRHKSLGFKLTSLDSDSVGEWLCHPHPVPGLEAGSQESFPREPQPSLGGATEPLRPPPHVSAGEAEPLRVHTCPALPASLHVSGRTERAAQSSRPTRPPRPQFSSLILCFKRTQQTPHFPNWVSNCARVPNTNCSVTTTQLKLPQTGTHLSILGG